MNYGEEESSDLKPDPPTYLNKIKKQLSEANEELKQLRSSLPNEVQQCVGNDINLLKKLTKTLLTRVPAWSCFSSSSSPLSLSSIFTFSRDLSSLSSWEHLHEVCLQQLPKSSLPSKRDLLLVMCKRCSKVLHISAFSSHLKRCQKVSTRATRVQTLVQSSSGTKRNVFHSENTRSNSNLPPSKRRRLCVDTLTEMPHTSSDPHKEGIKKRKVTSNDMRRLVKWVSMHPPQPLIRSWSSTLQRVEHSHSFLMAGPPLSLTLRIRHRLKRNGVTLLSLSQAHVENIKEGPITTTTTIVEDRTTATTLSPTTPTSEFPVVIEHRHTTETQPTRLHST